MKIEDLTAYKQKDSAHWQASALPPIRKSQESAGNYQNQLMDVKK